MSGVTCRACHVNYERAFCHVERSRDICKQINAIYKSGPPRLAEQEHRDMLRSLAAALTALFRPEDRRLHLNASGRYRRTAF